LIVFFGGMISLALALFNILPIPALDGWRLLWVVIQTLFRIRPEKYFSIEWYVNTVSFLVLMVLGIYIIFKDLVRCRGITIPFLG
jgi:regulator of sigma E protease